VERIQASGRTLPEGSLRKVSRGVVHHAWKCHSGKEGIVWYRILESFGLARSEKSRMEVDLVIEAKVGERVREALESMKAEEGQ